MERKTEDIVEANRSQTVSETDPFTPERYKQFHSHLPDGTRSVLDVGCNRGRGGRMLNNRIRY